MSTKVMTLREGIRTRPRMYLGHVGQIGFGLLISNLIHSFASEFSAREAQIRVTGRGIVTMKFTRMTSDPNMLLALLRDGRPGDSRWNFSLVLIEAISKRTRIKIGPKIYKCDVNGHITPKLVLAPKSKVTRFEITFQPDKKILNASSPDVLALCERLHELALVCRGLKITYRDDNTNPFTQMVWHIPAGIRTLLQPARNMFYDKKLEGAISFNEKGLRGEVYWLCANGGSDPIFSFANGERTVNGGSHVKGCVQGILDALKNLVKGNGEKYDFNVNRAIQHQCLVVSVWGNDLRYGGSTKECLEDEQTRKVLRKLVAAHMKQLCESHPGEVIQLTYRLKKWNLSELYPDLYPKKSTKKKK